MDLPLDAFAILKAVSPLGEPSDLAVESFPLGVAGIP